jgi:Bacteroidetes-specific putative membrane protein
MKTSVRFCWLVWLLAHHLAAYAQQDIHFSQFYEFPLLRNPALSGIFNGHYRLTGGYRNQWQSVTVPYRSMYMGSEFKLLRGFEEGDFITAGVQATNDVAGDSKLQRTQVFPVLNYYKLLNEDKTTHISFALTGGPVFERFDATKLQFDDQFVNGAYSPSNPTRQQFEANSFTYNDLSAGISFKTMPANDINLYVGAALFHINEPRVAFTPAYDVWLNRKWGLNGGFSAGINHVDRIVVYADCFVQGGNRLVQGGALYTHSFDYTGEEASFSIVVGGVYRWKDAFVPVLKLYTGQLGIGISYDVNISTLSAASQFRGGFEMSLSYMGMWETLARGCSILNVPSKYGSKKKAMLRLPLITS